MPTVLDLLRRHLLGDEAADRLELAVAILTARALSGLHLKTRLRRNSSSFEVDISEMAEPSPGYEPLLMKMGWKSICSTGAGQVRSSTSPKASKGKQFISPSIKGYSIPCQRFASASCACALCPTSPQGVGSNPYCWRPALPGKCRRIQVYGFVEISSRWARD